MEDELGGKFMIKFVKLIAKTCSYLIDDNNEDKTGKGTKKFVIKRKLKFENYKNCLEATQPKNKVSYIEKNKTDIDSMKTNHKELIKTIN